MFFYDVTGKGTSLGKCAIRIAVKDEQTNKKMIEILEQVLEECKTLRKNLAVTNLIGIDNCDSQTVIINQVTEKLC